MDQKPLQTHPDFVYTKPDEWVKENTNPRYKFFRQNHFTAGDYEQFLQFWATNPGRKKKVPVFKKHIQMSSALSWPRYRQPCVHDVFNTYLYLSEKFKKGIFIKVYNQELRTFLPFSRVHFTNEWHDKIRLDPKRFGSIQHLMAFVAKQDGKPFVEGRVHKDIKSWYGNNGLVRLEFPISEGDSGCSMIKNMFDVLCMERKVPDCEFFVNKRDFPLLTRDGTESYDSFFGRGAPLVSHDYEKYAPILSMTTTDRHADIPIPTWEDWTRVANWHDGRLFYKEFRSYPRPEEFDAIPWGDRQPTAVFRGASTGLGTEAHNNPRLFFAAESAKKRVDVDGVPFLDAGITKWNLRPRKHPSSPYLDTIHIDKMPFGLVESLDPLQQARFKYILHLPGHSFAYRLSLELFSGSVVLLYPCEYKIWYSDWLVPWEHYIPLDPSDPEDIYKKVAWCKANDDRCKEIASNAREFAHAHLCKDFLLDYLEAVLWRIVEQHGRIRHTTFSLDRLFAAHSKKRIALFEEGYHQMLKDPLIDLVLSRREASDVMPSSAVPLYTRFLFQRDPDLLSKLPKRNVIETRNTLVSRFDLPGCGAMVHKSSKNSWKGNPHHAWHAAVCGLNELAETLPNFLRTHHSTGKERETTTVMDFCPGETLETFIRTRKAGLHSLIDIWLQLALALHVAQQRMGLIHMDLYPWNVMIRRSDPPVDVVYPLDTTRSMRVSTSVIPVIIDYEKCHFVDDGLHFYNTIPFRFCRIQDMISIVFSSLHLFLENTQINEKDAHRVLVIMNFFRSSYTGNHRFRSISHVRLFLKKHKKFSKMMMESKTGLEQKTLLDFFQYLVHPEFKRVVLHHSPKLYIGEPPALRTLHAELDVIQTFFLTDSEISLEEKRVSLRRFWIQWEKRLPVGSGFRIVNYFEQEVRNQALSRIRESFLRFESHAKCRIWDRLEWQDLIKETVPIPTQEVVSVFDKMCSGMFFSNKAVVEPDVPLLLSHVCPTCIEQSLPPKKPLSMEEFWKLLFLVVCRWPDRLKELDLFRVWNMEFPAEFHRFLLLTR